MVKSRKRVVVEILALCFLGANAIWAARSDTNSFPYQESFEASSGANWTNNSPVNTTNGWYSTADDLSVITNLTYSFTNACGLPLATNAHTRVVRLNTQVAVLTNKIAGQVFGYPTNAYVDAMMQFVAMDGAPTTPSASVKGAIFVNTNKQLVVYHGLVSGNGTLTNTVMEPVNITIDTTQWYRVTVTFVPVAGTGGGIQEGLQIRLNGTLVTNALGDAYNEGWQTTWANTTNMPSPSTTGTWFMSAASTKNQKISAIDFMGKGYLDDLQVVKSDPMTTAPSSFAITVVSGANGTNSLFGSSLTGTVQVAQSATTSIVYTASLWYQIGSLTSNGTLVVGATGLSAYTQTLNNIQANISNAVTFAATTNSHIAGDYVVPVGQTLNVPPGYVLTVDGNLIVNGTATIDTHGRITCGQLQIANGSSLAVTAGSLTVAGASVHGTFTLTDSMGTLIITDDFVVDGGTNSWVDSHVVVSNATKNVLISAINNAVFSITDGTRIEKASGTSNFFFRIANGCTFTMTGSTLKDCGVAGTTTNAGLYIDTPNATLLAVTLTNDYIGLALGANAAGTVIRNSSIAGNTADGVYNNGTTPIDATYNWWGAANGPSSVGPGSGDHVSANVTYSPYLNQATLLSLSSPGIYTPGTNITVYGSLAFDTSLDLLSLEMDFALPAGWTLTGAVGVSGSPTPDNGDIGSGIITYTGLHDLETSPIQFALTLLAPTNAVGAQSIGSLVGYWPLMEDNPLWAGGSPDPLILRQQAVVTINPDLGTYDGTAKPATVTTVPTNLSVVVTYNGASASPTNAGSYTVVATIVDSGRGGCATQTCTISQKALSITANDASKTYGATVTFAGTEFTTSGLVSGDTVTNVTLTSAGAVATATVVGSPYSIVPSAALGTGLANYTITYNNGTLTVNAKGLSITANDTSKTYGATVTFAGTEFTSSGLVNGDSVTNVTLTSAGAVATATVAGSPYSIVPSAALGTGLANYTITYNNGTLTVNAKGLSITANDASKTYGATVTFAGTEFTSSGLVNGDTVTNVTLTSAGAVATATVAGSPYSIVPSAALGTGLANYTITYNNGTLTVNAKSVTVTADAKAMQVGNSLPTLTYTVLPTLVNGDVFSGGLACNTTPGTVGTYPITQGDLNLSSSYSITFVGANLVIVDIAQTGVNFRSPGNATGIKVEFFYPDGALTNLTWTPSLPAGWTLLSATNTAGALTVAGSSVMLTATGGANLGVSPLTFWVAATVPGNQASIVAFTNATVSLAFIPTNTSAVVATLSVADEAVSWRIHSADYRNALWVIDATEMNRVLAYWRAGGYHLNGAGYDGYAPGFIDGNVNAALHSADYDGTNGVISADEATRVIGYWRAGGYHPDVTGLDGYAAYAPATQQPMSLEMPGEPTALGTTITQSGPAEYDAGGTVNINCVLTYEGRLLATSWRPVLPAGWLIISVSGDGNPELNRGEVLWTGSSELPNPLVFNYTVQVPVNARGSVALGCEAHPLVQGTVNPLVAAAQPLQMTVITDTNGMASGWEMHYFGHTGVDPLADPDGDGMNNLQEYLAGTNPHDGQSLLVIQSFNGADGKMILNWQSASNRTYRVESAATPAGPFTPLATGIATTPPVNTMEFDKVAGFPFIRVAVEEDP
jgi:hypothetical protein